MAPSMGFCPVVTANGHRLDGTTPGYGHMEPYPYQPRQFQHSTPSGVFQEKGSLLHLTRIIPLD